MTQANLHLPGLLCMYMMYITTLVTLSSFFESARAARKAVTTFSVPDLVHLQRNRAQVAATANAGSTRLMMLLMMIDIVYLYTLCG